MRDFEEPYFNWLIEMSYNDVPDIGICNNLINAVNNLKNCEDECKEDDDDVTSPTVKGVVKVQDQVLPTVKKKENDQKNEVSKKDIGRKKNK